MQVPESVLSCQIDVHQFRAYPRRFKSGSVGWYHSGKLEVDGVKVQVSLSIVVVKSKPADLDPTKDTTREVDMGGGVTLFHDGEKLVPAPTDPASVSQEAAAKKRTGKKKGE